MKWSPRTWFLLSMLLFTGAWVSWQKGDEIQRRKHPIAPTPPATSPNPVTSNAVQQRISLRSTSNLTNQPALTATGAVDPYPLRLKNTTKTVGQLIGSDHAVLLRNALFDTSDASEAPIPDSLKSEGDPGSYVVQAKSIISRQFREALASAGARIVSYVPNNAFLVRMSASTAQTLRGDETVQAIVAYEPYYKLDFGLLKLVVKEEPLPADAWVRVGLFPDTEQSAREAIELLGGFVGGSDRSPFGPELLVQPKPDSLAALARLPQVQNMERARVRKPANDLTRVQTGVSVDSITTNNHLSLSGSNIWVGVVDGGIDRDHPAIKGRVFGPPSPYIGSFFSGKDPAGHGTFVTATLIGSDDGDVGINAAGFQGSETNASFRGMAHGAKVFAMPFDYFPFPNRAPTDTYLQETAADTNYNVLNRKDTLISNNSWVYDGSYDYDSSAARYDSAVRDALPGQTGYQPVSYVFPVGNAGGGNDFGQAGEAMTIASPATAKNVISVGAIEHFRNITNGELATNIVEIFDGETNILQTNIVSVMPFKEIGDSQVEVASFSGRGNVGIGIEGDFGRFKPDVVAPGTVVVSAKSENWKLEYDFATNSPQYKALADLYSSSNSPPEGFRVDSGTSFAAPAVSGMLALVQEFFEEKAPDALKIPKMSPALMKALLINSARSTGGAYDLDPKSVINYQGWGLPNLVRMLPFQSGTNLIDSEAALPIRLIDQSATNALWSGASRSWSLTLNSNALNAPLRFTLVWTDPAGNPAVGVKLVNDLDLIVTAVSSTTNEPPVLSTNVVYFGNNFGASSDYTSPTLEDVSQADREGLKDRVNNVENIFIRNPSEFQADKFIVTVRAHRVNVKAVDEFYKTNKDTNEVAQDFALVIGTDANSTTNSFKEFKAVDDVLPPDPKVAVTPLVLTNGLPLFDLRSGANSAIGLTNGAREQWTFIVFTNLDNPDSPIQNSNEFGQNVAFVTFTPPNLSRQRAQEADLDLYVSRGNSNLFKLDKIALDAAFKSRSQLGSEFVFFTNSTKGEVFYIGVKSEDQQAGEFSLIGVATEKPFEEERNGRKIITGIPVTTVTPDGLANKPRAGVTLALGISTGRIQDVTVTNIMSHEDVGDLYGVLRHNRRDVVLNNHTLNYGLFSGFDLLFVYNDGPFAPARNPNDARVPRPSDGPGSLNDYLGQKIAGPWLLQMIDNTPGHTGRVELLTLSIAALREPLRSGGKVNSTVEGGSSQCYPIDVPANATNLILKLKELDNATGQHLEMYLQRAALPTTNSFLATTNGSGNQVLTYGQDRIPPLQADTYYLCVLNPNDFPINYDLLLLFEFGVAGDFSKQIRLGSRVDLADDASTQKKLTASMLDDRTVAEVKVGIVLEHPLVSDTVLRLRSPQGTTVVLAENRGGFDTHGFGLGTTNGSGDYGFAVFTDDEALTKVPIKFRAPPFADTTNLRGIVWQDGFEGFETSNFRSGEKFNDWEVSSGVVSIINDKTRSFEGTNFLTLGSGSIKRTLKTVPGRSYKLRFLYKAAIPTPIQGTGHLFDGTLGSTGATDFSYRAISAVSGHQPVSVFIPAVPTPLSLQSRWVTPFTDGDPSGSLDKPDLYELLFSLHGFDIAATRVTGRFTGIDSAQSATLNGAPIPGASSTPSSVFSAPWNVTSGFVDGINKMQFSINNGATAAGLNVELSDILLKALPQDPLLPANFFEIKLDGLLTNVVVDTHVLDAGPAYEVEFVADSTDTVLNLTTLVPEIWIDDMRLIDTGFTFLQPEEPLAIFKGERALGDWTLEIVDNRTGNTGKLVDWYLELSYAQASPPTEILLDGTSFPGTINNSNIRRLSSLGVLTPGHLTRDERQYFVVTTCPDTTQVIISFGSTNGANNLQLLVDQSGAPTGNPETDDYVPISNYFFVTNTSSYANAILLTTTSPAPAVLVPGKPIYLAVKNSNPLETNDFTLVANLDRSSCQTNSFPLPSKRLVKGVAKNGVAPASYAGASELFVLNAPANATVAQISLRFFGPGDLGMRIRRAQRPAHDGGDLIIDDPFRNPEIFKLSPQLEDTPYAADDYYVEVFNNSPYPVPFSITSDDNSTVSPAPSLSAVTVQSGKISFSFATETGADYAVDYSPDLKTWSQRVEINASGTTSEFSESASGKAGFYRVRKL